MTEGTKEKRQLPGGGIQWVVRHFVRAVDDIASERRIQEERTTRGAPKSTDKIY